MRKRERNKEKERKEERESMRKRKIESGYGRKERAGMIMRLATGVVVVPKSFGWCV